MFNLERGNVMYRKVDTDMGFTSREHEVEQFWKDTNTFEESERIREGQPLYMLYDGPPTANGKPMAVPTIPTRCKVTARHTYAVTPMPCRAVRSWMPPAPTP